MKSKRVLCEVRTAYVYIMCKCMAVERHYDGYWEDLLKEAAVICRNMEIS